MISLPVGQLIEVQCLYHILVSYIDLQQSTNMTTRKITNTFGSVQTSIESAWNRILMGVRTKKMPKSIKRVKESLKGSKQRGQLNILFVCCLLSFVICCLSFVANTDRSQKSHCLIKRLCNNNHF